MLVDNSVTRDSRVQKQAEYLARRGFQVTVLGRYRAEEGGPDSFRLGEAEVRLLRFGTRRRKHELSSLKWRDPLAYRSNDKAKLRRANVRIRAWELAAAKDAASAGSGGTLSFLQRVRFGLRRRFVVLEGKLVESRAQRSKEASTERRAMSGRRDRMTTAMLQRLMGDRAWRHLDPSLWD